LVGDDDFEYEVILTPQFLDDLLDCVNYVANVLSSPQAARQMYEVIRDKVLALSIMPQVALSYVSPTTGSTRYVISYNKYDIHYCIEGNKVKVLGLKHQLQDDRWIG
jgi:plasmid stabilization system protein ParE